MDKAEIRAIAEKALQGVDNVLHRSHGMSRVNSIEAALTAAYDQGWDEGVEAAAEAVRGPDSMAKDGWAVVKRAVDEIRRLKKGQGV